MKSYELIPLKKFTDKSVEKIVGESEVGYIMMKDGILADIEKEVIGANYLKVKRVCVSWKMLCFRTQ